MSLHGHSEGTHDPINPGICLLGNPTESFDGPGNITNKCFGDAQSGLKHKKAIHSPLHPHPSPELAREERKTKKQTRHRVISKLHHQ